MSLNFDFHNREELEQHQCESRREDDWIIFQCSQCDYTRRINWKTGDMKVSGGSMYVMHSGSHMPTDIDPNQITMN